MMDELIKEIEFKNSFEKKINIILENALKSAWNIDKTELKNIIANKEHLPIHQYPVCNNKYKIDFFFDRFKIIVEFDETRHQYQKEEDTQRMDEIIQYLSLRDGDCGLDEQGILRDSEDEIVNVENCDYMIVGINENDLDAVDKLIGLVIGNIFSWA